MKRWRSMSVKTQIDSTNLGIIRNSKVKYVKAEAFKKHEKIRDMEFEQKLCELTTFNVNKVNTEKYDSFKENKDSNSKWLEPSIVIDSLNEDSEEDKIKPYTVNPLSSPPLSSPPHEIGEISVFKKIWCKFRLFFIWIITKI